MFFFEPRSLPFSGAASKMWGKRWQVTGGRELNAPFVTCELVLPNKTDDTKQGVGSIIQDLQSADEDLVIREIRSD